MTDIISSDWTELDADNTNPSPNGVQGGYQPSTIAPIIRGIRGAIKRTHVRTNPYYTTTGTGNAYVLTYVGAPLTYTKGDKYQFFADRANTGAATININSLGAKSIIMPDGSALTANQIKAGRVVEIIYNGTSFLLTSVVDQNLKFGDATASTLRLTSTTDASETSTGHALQIGDTATQNLIIDNNEIMVRTNGVLNALLIPGGVTFNGDKFLAIQDGGTGANTVAGARTALGLAAVANTGSASSLTTGTLADARLPTSMTGKTFTSSIVVENTADVTYSLRVIRDGAVKGQFGVLSGTGYNPYMARIGADGSTFEASLSLQGTGATNLVHTYSGGSGTVWHSGNDGSGSGLDADLLDGQDGAFFRNASNLNAGTIPDARLSGAYSGITTLSTTGLHTITNAGEALRVAGPAAADDPYMTFYAGGVRQAYIQHTDGTATGAGFRFFNDVTDDYLYLSNVNDISALKFYDSSVATHQSVWHTGNLTGAQLNSIYGYTPANGGNSIVAGNGLSGGGTYGATRTLTLGTPGSITNSTTNSVTTTSHVHALGFTAAEVYGGTGLNDTGMPVGHMIIARGVIARNASTSVWIDGSNTNRYVTSVDGAQLSGTYRGRGQYTENSNQFSLLQRTA